MARHGKAWQGMARHGKAWQGMARHGKAWQGIANAKGSSLALDISFLAVLPTGGAGPCHALPSVWQGIAETEASPTAPRSEAREAIGIF